MIDGVGMNNAIYLEGINLKITSLDPNAAESAGIVFGTVAIVYTRDAICGVLNFHTGKVMLSTIKLPVFRDEFFIRYLSADNEKRS